MRKIATTLLLAFILLVTPTTIAFAADKEQVTNITCDGVEYTDSDIELLARLIAAEARGENYLGQLAVGNNVINRCLDTYYPNTIRSNIYRSGQYTVVRGGKLRSGYTESTYKAAYDILVNGTRVLPYWTLNFQVGNTNTYKYTRIGNHTFNYRIHSDNLWRIWCDAVEEPQYFIDRLSDKQIEIALESMPSYYSFDWNGKIAKFANVNNSDVAFATEVQNQKIEITRLNNEIGKLKTDLEVQKNISANNYTQYINESSVKVKYGIEIEQLNYVAIALFVIIGILIFINLKKGIDK